MSPGVLAVQSSAGALPALFKAEKWLCDGVIFHCRPSSWHLDGKFVLHEMQPAHAISPDGHSARSLGHA